jgi:gluconate 2-dehydrogenase gamma chain
MTQDEGPASSGQPAGSTRAGAPAEVAERTSDAASSSLAAPAPTSPAAAVSRRRWIQATAGVLGGSAAAAVVLGERLGPAPSPSEGAPAAPPAPARVPRFPARLFSPEQALFVEDLAEHIVPEGDSPGAISAGVPAYIADIVTEVNDEPERQQFLRGIDAANLEARTAYGRPFHECSAPERETLVARWLERSEPSLETNEPWCFFQAFRELCIEGFCRSQLGATRVLQYDAVPGEYRGCVPLAQVGRAWATS